MIAEAFSWQDFRTVTKTATISLHGNRYQVDPALSGRKVELLYNPADLTGGIRVRWRGTDMGEAVPHVIGLAPPPRPGPGRPRPGGADRDRLPAHDRRSTARSRLMPSTSPPSPATGRATPATAGRRDPGDPQGRARACRAGDLAGLLADGAAGLLAGAAAVQLLARHGCWLSRTDFTGPFIAAGPSPLSGQPLALCQATSAVGTVGVACVIDGGDGCGALGRVCPRGCRGGWVRMSCK